MKIEFREGGQTQAPVSPAQERMRNATPKRTPVLPLLILIAIIGGGTYLWFQTQNSDKIYTYGLVSSQYESVIAPRPGVVTALSMRRGDTVTSGQALLTISPLLSEEGEIAEKELMEALDRSREGREARREGGVKLADAEVERLQRVYDEEVAKRDHDLRIAEIEVTKLSEFHAQKQERLRRLRELYNLDAAVRSDVDAAKNEVQMALRNLEQAQEVEDLARTRAIKSESELEMAKFAAEQARTLRTPDSSDLERARIAVSISNEQREPITVSAPFDGFVLELEVTENSHVLQGTEIGSIARSTELWVDVYIPPDRYGQVDEGDRALVYIPGTDEAIEGTIASKVGAVVRPPEIIRDDLPGLTTTLYARVELPEDSPLVPGTETRVVIHTAD